MDTTNFLGRLVFIELLFARPTTSSGSFISGHAINTTDSLPAPGRLVFQIANLFAQRWLHLLSSAGQLGLAFHRAQIAPLGRSVLPKARRRPSPPLDLLLKNSPQHGDRRCIGCINAEVA